MIEHEFKTLTEFINAIPEEKTNKDDIIMSKSSKRKNISSLKGLFNKDPSLTVSDFIDFDFTIDFINKHYDTTMKKKNVLVPYHSVFNKFNFVNRTKEQKENIENVMKDFWKDCNKEQNKQDYDFEGMTFEKLINMFECMKDNIEIKLALALNVLIPPRRSGDYHYAVFVDKLPDTIDKETNYIVVSNDTVEFYFYKIKNSKIYENGFYYKKICNESYNYLDKLPFLNPNRLRDIIIEYHQKIGGFKIFKNYYSIMYDNLNINQNMIRHLFSQVVYNTELKINVNTEKSIAYDFGDKGLINFKLYSNPDYIEEPLIKEKVIDENSTDEEIEEELQRLRNRYNHLLDVQVSRKKM